MSNFKKKNILFLDHGAKPVGGGQVNTLSLIKGLDKASFTPIIVSSKRNSFTVEAEIQGIRVEIVPYPEILTSTYRGQVKYGPLALSKYFVSGVKLILSICGFIRANHIDLIHPCDNISRIAGGIAAKIMGIPAVCHITDDLEDTFTNKGLRRVILWTMAYIMPVSNKAGNFFKINDKAAKKIKTVYTGIDLDCFDALVSGSTLRNEFGVNKEEIVIGIVGLLIPIKGHRELFKALALLKKESVPPFRCIVVGEGAELEILRKISIEIGLSHEIVFTGFRKDVANLLRGMDILVAPSTSEASSRVLLEAGALKLPVVGTRVGGIPEMIVENETGFLVPVGDIRELADAIKKLFDPELRTKMGAAARLRIEDTFCNKKITREIETVYAMALGHAGEVR